MSGPYAATTSGEGVDRAVNYLREFLEYEPGKAPHPQREKANGCVTYLLQEVDKLRERVEEAETEAAQVSELYEVSSREAVRKARANRRAMPDLIVFTLGHENMEHLPASLTEGDLQQMAERLVETLDVWPRNLADPALLLEERVEPPLTIDLMNALKNEVLVQRLWGRLNLGDGRIWTQDECREIIADLVRKSR